MQMQEKQKKSGEAIDQGALLLSLYDKADTKEERRNIAAQIIDYATSGSLSVKGVETNPVAPTKPKGEQAKPVKPVAKKKVSKKKVPEHKWYTLREIAEKQCPAIEFTSSLAGVCYNRFPDFPSHLRRHREGGAGRPYEYRDDAVDAMVVIICVGDAILKEKAAMKELNAAHKIHKTKQDAYVSASKHAKSLRTKADGLLKGLADTPTK